MSVLSSELMLTTLCFQTAKPDFISSYVATSPEDAGERIISFTVLSSKLMLTTLCFQIVKPDYISFYVYKQIQAKLCYTKLHA